jgi:hypothetical protein
MGYSAGLVCLRDASVTYDLGGLYQGRRHLISHANATRLPRRRFSDSCRGLLALTAPENIFASATAIDSPMIAGGPTGN